MLSLLVLVHLVLVGCCALLVVLLAGWKLFFYRKKRFYSFSSSKPASSSHAAGGVRATHMLRWLCLATTMSTVCGVACPVTDGSKANDAACTCGNEECTALTGLICYSTTGGGSCRMNDVGAYGYPRPSGKCPAVSGRKSIPDKASCEVAATSLGLMDTTASPPMANDWSSLAYHQDASGVEMDPPAV